MDFEGSIKMLTEDIPNITDGEPHKSSDLTVESEKATFNFETRELSKSLPSPSDPAGANACKKLADKLLHHCLPITSMKLLDGTVLVAAEGPSLLIKMAYLSDSVFQRFQLFPSQFVISGMEFVHNPSLECGDNLAEWYKKSDKPFDHIYVGFVWAGSVGTVVKLTRTTNIGLQLMEYNNDKCFNEVTHFDFIPVTCRWLEAGKVLALLSVLNYVVLYERIETKNCAGIYTSLKELARIRCTKSETLFSGKIYGETRNDMRIFAGTVFDGICVWDVVENSRGVIKHELKCHDGIIFSLEYFTDRGILLSTSDDRTVAAWQFSGTGDDQEVTLIRRFYGHDARVWKAVLVHGYVISVGESSDVRVNILKDGQEHKSWEAHKGAPIFTCVYDEDVEILYTGGNDGSIKKWPKWWYRLKPRILPYDVVPSNDGSELITQTKSSGRWSENYDYPKTIVLLDINHVLVSMESGRIMALTWEGRQFDLLYDAHCKGFQIIRISPDQKILAVAGNEGHFYTAKISISENQSSKTAVINAKKIFMTKISSNILSLIWVDVTRLLVICFNRVIALLLQNNEEEGQSEVKFIQTFELNFQRPGVPAALEVFAKYLVLGDELGSLHVLRYHKSNEVIRKFEKAHKDGVTGFLFHNSTIYSSGRDGKVRTFSMTINSENDLDVELIPLTSVCLTFDWITGMYVNMEHMLICGFQKEDFVVHSHSERKTLARIPCSGGGNKKWDFRYGHGEQSRNASFTFIKDKEVFYTFLPMDGYLNNTLKEGLHSRTINCASQVRSSECDSMIEYLTGSEDGSLKWFRWDIMKKKIVQIQNMENHVSSVRTMCQTTTTSNRSLSFSGGGRSQLCIYELDYSSGKIELLKEIVLVKTSCKKTEGDVRIMDTVVVEGYDRKTNDLWCFSACSDGYVRILYFNAVTGKFKIVGLLNGNAHAVMRIQLLKTDCIKDGLLICGVTSNGYLIIWSWSLNDTLEQSNLTSVHEKKSIYLRLLRRTAFLSMKLVASSSERLHENCLLYTLICGGDDCSISVWSLTVTQDKDRIQCNVSEKWTNDQLQRGAVVGVDICENNLYTLSNDQIVGLWSLSGNLKKTQYAGVSDCQGFLVDKPNGCIMCYGKGISWIPIELDDSE